jgi:diamine N-acetyltransferase
MQLRPARIDDVPLIMAMERTPEYHFQVGKWTQSEHLERMAGSSCRYFVAEAQPGELAGFAILVGLDSPHRSVCLQRIAVKHPGQGIGTMILHQVLDCVFGELKAHRLWLDVFETNTRAQHVYASLGFRHEGRLREAIFRDGEYHTQLLMSILDREYQAMRHERLGGAGV